MTVRKGRHASVPPPPLAGEGRGGGRPRWFVKPTMRKRARALRLNSTDAERIMWRALQVLRFSNLDIIQNRAGVLTAIADVLENAPSLSLPRKRGREENAAHPEQERKGGLSG